MQAFPYKYLFPFEKIPVGARILIYGAGEVGYEYFYQIALTKYCTCIGFLDKAFGKFSKAPVPVYSPEKVGTLSFDYIVLAFKTEIYVRSVLAHLEQLGIPEDKLIYIGPRKEKETFLSEGGLGSDDDLAYKSNRTAIALRYGSNLGDAIIRKAVFQEIVRIAPDCIIDIYAPNANEIIQAVYSDQKSLHCVIDDNGKKYHSNMHSYMFSATVLTTIQVDVINEQKILDYCPDFLNFALDMQKCTEQYALNCNVKHDNFVHYCRMIYKGKNHYTAYNQFSRYFRIMDRKVSIPLSSIYERNFKEMNLKNYISINYGNGVTGGNTSCLIAKQWPFEYFQELIRLIHHRYPSIAIVQMGLKDSTKLDDVDSYCFGENLELVKYVLKESILHIDIDGGLVHLATQLGTKCAVLFGPTPVDFFGYPQNINITGGNCSGCYAIYNDISVCAKGQEKPECMYSITPNMVMEYIKEYIGEVVNTVNP